MGSSSWALIGWTHRLDVDRPLPVNDRIADSIGFETWATC